MPITLMVHIAAGGVGIVTGFVALFAAKGAGLHRGSGRVFVYAMVTMGGLGSAIAAWRGGEISVIAGLLTAYLVTTGMTTVLPPTAGSRRLDLGAMVLALSLGVTSFTLNIASRASGETTRDGVGITSLLVFGTVALLAGLGDVRVIRAGEVRGPARLARHLWRMCFALWIASSSFFLGQADKIPESLRIPTLLLVPVLTPLVAMLYWLWRVRARKPSRAPLPVAAPEPI